MRGKKHGSIHLVLFIPIFILLAGILSPALTAHSEERSKDKKDLPPRAISIAPDYTGVIVDQGDDVSIDVKVYNNGRHDENIYLTVESIPKGWTAWIKTYNYGVTGVFVPSDDFKSLTLRAEPDKDVGPGKYTFKLRAQTSDHRLSSIEDVVIEVKKKKEKDRGPGDNHLLPCPPGTNGREIRIFSRRKEQER